MEGGGEGGGEAEERVGFWKRLLLNRGMRVAGFLAGKGGMFGFLGKKAFYERLWVWRVGRHGYAGDGCLFH